MFGNCIIVINFNYLSIEELYAYAYAWYFMGCFTRHTFLMCF